MSSKHTPGPWIIEPEFLCEVQTAGKKTIASCWESRDAGSHIEVTGTLECSEAESIANARLIAAAPELLEAAKHCEWLLTSYELNRIDAKELADNALFPLRAAIDKATGEQP